MGKYTHLSEKERENLYLMLKNGIKHKKIAKIMERNPSTISREIKRNSSEFVGYLPDKAQHLAIERKAKKVSKIFHNEPLKQFIENCLFKYWSPLIIAGRMRQQQLPFYACPETIYQYIYHAKEYELFWFLPQQRKKRGQLYGRKPRKINFIERLSIHERPAIVDKRLEIGHFEGDLVFHKGNASENISVLVERKTRYTILAKNQSKASLQLIMNLYHNLKKLPEGSVKTLTLDNGSEFTHHYLLKRGLGIKTYFCDAFSAWQKGQVERVNRTIRRFLDKKRPLADVSDEELLMVQNRLNFMPRKVLGFKTPWEAFNEERCTSS